MPLFVQGHAGHPDWRTALVYAGAQIDAAQVAAADPGEPTLGFVYFSHHYSPHAGALLAALRERWPGMSWAGSVGIGVLASGVEYFDEPALSLLLTSLPRGSFKVFSGAQPLGRFGSDTALVHADPSTPELAELVAEMSERTASHYVFGGLASSVGDAMHIADGVFRGGLSGVAFAHEVGLVSRVTQGCQPIGPVRRITGAERNIIHTLDGEPALDALFADLRADVNEPRAAIPKLRATLVGISDARDTTLARPRQFGEETRVRHLVGIDPGAQSIAVAEVVEPGMQLAFCQRDMQAARRDLVRICSEIRDEVAEGAASATLHPAALEDTTLEHPPARRIVGALYFSCTGRGGPHFGGPSAEAQIVQRALGDVPLAGFFAGGEIGHRHLYGYTGVLTVFTAG